MDLDVQKNVRHKGHDNISNDSGTGLPLCRDLSFGMADYNKKIQLWAICTIFAFYNFGSDKGVTHNSKLNFMQPKTILIIAMLAFTSLTCFSQAKKDTTQKFAQLPKLDSLHLIWMFEALNKGTEAWDERQDISAKDAKERKQYVINLIQFLGVEYQRLFYKPPVTKADSTNKK